MHFYKLQIICAIFFNTLSIFPGDKIEIMYYERTPYMISDDQGNISGLTASVVDYAFKKANIPFEWINIPAQRQLVLIKKNKSKIGGLGWFKNPERELFSNFSIPLYQDKQIQILARKDNFIVSNQKTLDTLFSNKSLALATKSSYSYGNYIDNKIATLQPHMYVLAGGDTTNLLKMINSKRADYIFISQEEATLAIINAGFSTRDFQLLTLKDIPVGEKRYLMFSNQVDITTITTINRYIEEYLSKN